MASTDTTRWTVEQTPVGWALVDSQRWDEQSPIMAHDALTQEQAEYAVAILNADGLGDIDSPAFTLGELRDQMWVAVVYTNCTSCGLTYMQGTLDSSKRCIACQS